ncbi:mercuric reductase [Hymenobacter busanensis]|uniref:Mercuric reductase n=1 Tax=Hymenobacter busanensis TaxID=2607656 RepID=A0A7L4ZVP9_9BACT|nr:mercuric reductase [Hymenobacter busanensis]KAA9332112.1 mercuric reductase [Hymenobacter busanensis]QHJ07549.1 FAD-dependent oxidoreductase [Hymenobacter busanensis]
MPTPSSFDALIIGSGQAGNPLAYALADAGRRVALIEQDHLGGSCINYGCSPTKALLAAAHRAHDVRTAGELGISVAPPVLDMPAVIARKNALVARHREAIRKNLTVEHPGITVLHGHAAFVGPHTLLVTPRERVEAERVTAPLVFINTGTQPAWPAIEGIQHVGALTNETLLDLPELPEHLVILGGSYIGVEFGQMYRRFGSRVTIVDTEPRIMAREDADVSKELQKLLEAEGVEFVLGGRVQSAARGTNGHVTLTVQTRTGERRLRGSHLLLATGRTPNTASLNLGAAGIKTDEHGFVVVDERLHTGVRGVYALGDVKGGPQFTHISYDDYRLVRDQVLHGIGRRTEARPVPYVVFTDPQLGCVGLSEKEAKKQGVPYRVGKLPVFHIGRARETGRTAGFIKVLVGADDRLLGAAVLSPEGGEIMSMLQIAMAGRLKYQQLRDMVLAHPTWAEALNNVFAQLK